VPHQCKLLCSNPAFPKLYPKVGRETLTSGSRKCLSENMISSFILACLKSHTLFLCKRNFSYIG